MLQPTAATDKPPFHEALKTARLRRQMSLNDVSRRCGVSVAVVEDWEAGRDVPDVRAWKKLLASCFNQLSVYAHEVRQQREANERADAEHRVTQPTVPPAAGDRRAQLKEAGAQYGQLLADVAAAEVREREALDAVEDARTRGKAIVEEAQRAVAAAERRAEAMVTEADAKVRAARDGAQQARELAEMALAELQSLAGGGS